MHHLLLNGRPREVAENWNELSRAQLLRLIPVLYHHFKDKTEQGYRVIDMLFGVSVVFALRFTPVQYLEIRWLADFLLGEHVGLTKNLLPWVRAKWYQRPLYGPSDGLSNVRFLEFVFDYSYFVSWAQRQEQKWLHLLLAVLYRPQRWPYRPLAADFGGDRRQDFNENLIERRLARVAQLPAAEQLAIVTWYRGCRHALEAKYPLVFTSGGDGQTSENTGDWGQALREMSGQAFGSFEETGRQHLHTVLAKMEDDLRRAQELRRQAEAQKTSY